MENIIYDETNGLYYERRGEYYYPLLTLPKEKQVRFGKWGQEYLNHIKRDKKVLFGMLMGECKLGSHVMDIDKQAEEMHSFLIVKYKEQYGINEKLKAENQLLWVKKMNQISNMADEVVRSEIIYS